MFDEESKKGAEAAKRRDALLGKYREHITRALGATNAAEREAALEQSRTFFAAAKLEQKKLRQAQQAAIDELERWKSSTEETWSQIEQVALGQLAAADDPSGEASGQPR